MTFRSPKAEQGKLEYLSVFYQYTHFLNETLKTQMKL